MTKRFSKYRLKKNTYSRKNPSFQKIIAVFFIAFFILLFPLIRIAFGPFGSFVWNAGNFWNSTIVVLLQNEAEIRPTGGFLSAIALVEIQSGKPKISVIDSYSIINPSEKIRAPKPIQEVFSQDPKYKGWVFRDANFSPDFPTSVQQILKFLRYDSRFSQKKIDAVVSLNFEAVRDMFLEFGPINGISAESLFLSLQRETKNIDLHSVQQLKTRKNALGESAKILVRKIGYFSLPKALASLAKSADKKDVQMWFSHLSLQKKVSQKKWDGSLPLENFFSVNIANLGAKKSDRYLFKHYYSDISIDSQGKMTEDFTLQFRHRGGENLYSGAGFYFIRVFRPYGTSLLDSSSEWAQKTTVGQMEEFSIIIFLHPGETKNEKVSFVLSDSWKAGEKNFSWS